jgi:hypothetical protein
VTKNLQTTTILYYTFFLPGVVINQIIIWFTAGIVNVRADRAIEFPEAQEVAQLRLDFIQIDKRRTNNFKIAVISIAPLLVGIAAIWYIGNNILVAQRALDAMGDGSLANLPDAISVLTHTPDFWLWIYITFTIGNTMMPDFADLKGARIILIVIAIVVGVLFVLGAGIEVTQTLLNGPVSAGLSFLAWTFAFIIFTDLLMVAILGTIEAIIERVTGDSATFDQGKLITMTREELIEQRKQEADKRERAKKKADKEPTGPPSVYKLPLPIPDAPGREAVPSPEVIIGREEPPPLPQPAEESEPQERPAPTIITGGRRPAQPARPDDADEKSAATAPPRPAFGAPPKPAEESTDDAEPARPAAARLSPSPSVSRPVPQTPPRPPIRTDDADDEERPARPAAPMSPSRLSAPGGLSRPAPRPVMEPFRRADDEIEGDEDEVDEEEIQDRPATPQRPAMPTRGNVPPRSPAFTRPAPKPGTPSASESSDEDEADRPAASRPRPSILTPNVPPRPPSVPRPAPKPTRPDDQDEPDEEDREKTSPRPARTPSFLGGRTLSRPPAASPPLPRPGNDDVDEDEDEEPDVETITGSRPAPRPSFLGGRTLSRPPAASPPLPRPGDDDDEPDDDEPRYEPFEDPA